MVQFIIYIAGMIFIRYVLFRREVNENIHEDLEELSEFITILLWTTICLAVPQFLK